MEQRKALVDSLVRNLVIHGQIMTTHSRAKEAQRLADRLVRFGKEGSIASRRQAFRVLRDRTLVKQLFVDIAPRFSDVPSGYTRVMRLANRRGDGAQKALLAFSRLQTAQAPKAPTAPQRPAPEAPKKKEEKASKGFLGGLRKLWTKKRKGSAAS